MELMTKELESKLLQYGLYGQEGKGGNSSILVKYFNPSGNGTWLITGGEKQNNGDWLLYGYCHLNEGGWGYLLLSELQKIYLPYGMKIERDIYLFDKTTVNDEIKRLNI